LLISIIACIGCTQFLNYLARKYLVIQSQLIYNTIKLSNTWLYIIGTLTNHCKYDYICNNSIKYRFIIYQLYFVIFFCISCKRSSQSTKICRNCGIHLASGDICFRQYLFLMHGFVHVTKIPTTRHFHISRFGQQSTLPANDY